MDGAAGTSQQGVEVEDIAEVLKDSRGRCDPLKLLISVQGTLFPRFTYAHSRGSYTQRIIYKEHEVGDMTHHHEVHMPPW